jgi:flavodoxin
MAMYERSRDLMHTVVVVDSEFGNTFQLAEIIAAELGAGGPVELINVRAPTGRDPLPADIDLFVVGGPTQMHRVSVPLSQYLDGLPPRFLTQVASASFDTRLRGWPVLTGAAAGGISRRLKKLGANAVVPPESFLVMGKEGPLAEGELERARMWAKEVLLRLGSARHLPVRPPEDSARNAGRSCCQTRRPVRAGRGSQSLF